MISFCFRISANVAGNGGRVDLQTSDLIPQQSPARECHLIRCSHGDCGLHVLRHEEGDKRAFRHTCQPIEGGHKKQIYRLLGVVKAHCDYCDGHDPCIRKATDEEKETYFQSNEWQDPLTRKVKKKKKPNSVPNTLTVSNDSNAFPTSSTTHDVRRTLVRNNNMLNEDAPSDVVTEYGSDEALCALHGLNGMDKIGTLDEIDGVGDVDGMDRVNGMNAMNEPDIGNGHEMESVEDAKDDNDGTTNYVQTAAGGSRKRKRNELSVRNAKNAERMLTKDEIERLSFHAKLVLAKKQPPDLMDITEWCRYCGSIYSEEYADSPWGPRKLCIRHYEAWYETKQLDLSGYISEPLKAIDPGANTDSENLTAIIMNKQLSEMETGRSELDQKRSKKE